MQAQAQLPKFTQTVRALDWGLTFALRQKKALFLLTLPAVICQLVGAYLNYSQALEPKQEFLLNMLFVITNCWELTMVVLFSVCCYRGEEIDLVSIAKQAALHLPKVILSFIIIMFFVDISQQVPPAFIVVVFSMWAPIYCAAENSATQSRREDDRDPGEEHSFFDDEDSQISVEPPVRHFAHVSVLDFGFMRSMRFVGQNSSVSLQFAALMWFANVFPAAVVAALSQFSPGLPALMLQIVITALVEVLVLAAGISAFLSRISIASREELGLAPVLNIGKAVGELVTPRVRLDGRTFPYIVLVTLSIWSSWQLAQYMQVLTSVPEHVRVSLLSSTFVENRFVVRVNMDDSKSEFRWFDRNAFRLEFADDEKLGGKRPMEEPETERRLPFAPAAEVELLQPFRIVVHGLDQEPIVSGLERSSQAGQLNLTLQFKIPKGLAAEGRFSLIYLAAGGIRQQIIESNYPKGW